MYSKSKENNNQNEKKENEKKKNHCTIKKFFFPVIQFIKSVY